MQLPRRRRRRLGPPPPTIVGTSAAIAAVREQISVLGPTELSVLVEGESGTGKELVARALHAASGRQGRFVPLNCGGFPEALVESELFGHVKGAFTGAAGDKEGLVEAAHGGTLFLDEIADLPRSVQAKLLRVLELGEARRVGGLELTYVDVRFVAATNQPLGLKARDGSFRSDLYGRLRHALITVPPLRERLGDIPLLVAHFSEQRDHRFPAGTLEALGRHSWPGNVRELRNAVDFALAMSRRGVVRPEHLPPDVRMGSPPDSGIGPGSRGGRSLRALREVERDHILFVVGEAPTLSRAAEILGIDRKTLRKRLREYGSG